MVSETAAPDGEQPLESASLFRGVGKHALIYAIGMLLSRAVSFVMLPVYTRYLTPADYGVMALIEMTLDFIAIIGGGNLALGVFRFYHKTDDEEARRRIVSTSFLLVGLLYFLVGGAVFAAANPMSRILFDDIGQAGVIRIAAMNLAAGSLMIVPMTFARVRDLSRLFVAATLVKLLLAVGLNLVFVVLLGMGVKGIFLSSLIASGLTGTVLAVWLLRQVGIRASREWTRDLLRYGIPLVAMQVGTFIATFSDRYFLQASAGEEAVGLYSLAYQFGFLMAMVGVTPMEMVWGPKRFEIAKRDDRDALLARGFTIVNVLMFTTAVGITLYVGDVLRVMSTPAFHSAANVVPVILLAYVFAAWAATQDIGILVREKTKYLAWINAATALVAITGYAVLVPLLSEWGAAIATVLAFVIRWLLTYSISQSLWSVRYEWRPILTLMAWSVCACGITFVLPVQSVLISLLERTAVLCLFLSGLWFLPILQSDDKALVRLAAWRVMSRWLGRESPRA